MIGIQRRPYAINLAGNSVLYQLFDSEAVNDTSYTFEVKVLFARYEEGLAPAEIAIIPLTPYAGVAYIDLADLLNSQLAYFTPDLAVGGAQVTGLQGGKFYIHYRRVSNSNTDTAWNTSEEANVCNVIKGGVHPYMWKGNNFFLNYFPTYTPFLTWQQRGRLASLNEPLWLCWLNVNLAGNVALSVAIQVTYTDGTANNTNYSIATPLKQYFIYYLPTGAATLGLQGLQPLKTIWYWDVWVFDTNGQQLTERYRYFTDQRNDYNQKFLLYRNSLGGLDTLRVRGIIETNITLDGQDVEMTSTADWPYNATLPRFDASTPHREMPAYKGDAGYLPKEEQDRLRDLFFNREIYMYQAGRLLPVKLTSKQYRLRATSDKLFSLPIEWMLADAGSYYYTPGVTLGDGQNNFIDLNNVDLGDGQSNGVCGVVLTFSPAVIIQYIGANATVTFEFTAVNGPAKKLQYKIPGYVINWIDIDYQHIGTVSYTVLAGQSITLYMRSVCDDDTYGEIVTKTAQTAASVTPNSTIRNNTGLAFTYTFLRNGVQIITGSLQPGEYDSFYVGSGIVDYDLQLSGVTPSSAKITTSLLTKNGTISGSNVHWENFTTLTNGITVIVS